MKRFLFAIVACVISIPMVAFAQGEPGFQKSSLGANFEISLPTDDLFKQVAGTGYGGNLRYQWGMDSRTAITATAGYLVWGKKDLVRTPRSSQGVQYLCWREILFHEGSLREPGRRSLLPQLHV